MVNKEVYYSDYLQLDKILSTQVPESRIAGNEAHDEMLFIIVHQAYELWFKQILHELASICTIMSAPKVNDNSPAIYTVVHRFDRIIEILRLLVQQVNIIETMTPLDFLDFRNMLRPASGFQSFQFKMIEASLGLKFDQRHGQGYYLSQLRQEHKEIIGDIESKPSVIELINSWLERMPYFDVEEYWTGYVTGSGTTFGGHIFWGDYRDAYSNSLVEAEKDNLEDFDKLFFDDQYNSDRSLSAKAKRSALFIMLYRDYPILQMPYKLLNGLLEIDELMATWRYRHMNMVHRMIGKRIGTGGSSGKDYLKASLEKHYIFSEIAELTSFLIERRNLPHLSANLESKLGFVH